MTTIVNIDALQEEPPFILVIGGKEHPMKIASVQDFVENMKMIEDLGTTPTFVQELDVSIKVIARAFPTLTEAEIRSWQVTTIEKLFKLTRGENPETKEGDAENPPTAS